MPYGLEWVQEAFAELSTSRAMGPGGAGRIPFTAVSEYADRYAIDDFDYFLHLVRGMDDVFMKHLYPDKEDK